MAKITISELHSAELQRNLNDDELDLCIGGKCRDGIYGIDIDEDGTFDVGWKKCGFLGLRKEYVKL
ncbi:MAG: hypothetical protein QNJ47_12000 [Nostocaceae cyanobacterium]|nr:hypothetical protein [Nostocaceae cyanobacterium]